MYHYDCHLIICSENCDTEDKLVEGIVLVITKQLHRVPLLQLHGLGTKEEIEFEGIRGTECNRELRVAQNDGKNKNYQNPFNSTVKGVKRGNSSPFCRSRHQGPIQEC